MDNEDITYYNGTKYVLPTDEFNNHVQTDYIYHLHGLQFAIDFSNIYVDKVIGYALDGYPVMGINSFIYEPNIDTSGHLIGKKNGNKNPGVSGWKLRYDTSGTELKQWSEEGISATSYRTTGNQLKLAPGFFHGDYDYSNNYVPTDDAHKLDKYNMGFIDYYDPIRGETIVMKAYLATIDYPYFIHTLYGSASNDTRTRE
jgi:hypothetical protein